MPSLFVRFILQNIVGLQLDPQRSVTCSSNLDGNVRPVTAGPIGSLSLAVACGATRIPSEHDEQGFRTGSGPSGYVLYGKAWGFHDLQGNIW